MIKEKPPKVNVQDNEGKEVTSKSSISKINPVKSQISSKKKSNVICMISLVKTQKPTRKTVHHSRKEKNSKETQTEANTK